MDCRGIGFDIRDVGTRANGLVLQIRARLDPNKHLIRLRIKLTNGKCSKQNSNFLNAALKKFYTFFVTAPKA